MSFLESVMTLHRASIGDISVLVERLRSQRPLTVEERQLAADLIEGKFPLPANRPNKLAIEVRDENMVVIWLMESQLNRAPKVTARVSHQFGVTPRHLQRIVQEARADERGFKRLIRRAQHRMQLFLAIEEGYKAERRNDIQERWDRRRDRRSLAARGPIAT